MRIGENGICLFRHKPLKAADQAPPLDPDLAGHEDVVGMDVPNIPLLPDESEPLAEEPAAAAAQAFPPGVKMQRTPNGQQRPVATSGSAKSTYHDIPHSRCSNGLV